MAAPDWSAPFSLHSYCVSQELGFVLSDPLQELPPYYQPWMDIALHVPQLVEAHQLRSCVDQMPLLSSQFLNLHRELRLAHLALGVMTMGYIWQEGEKNTVEMLPQNLAIPYWEVSQRLGLPPILTHADTVLANWRKKDPLGPFAIDNLELLVSIPGGDCAQGFFLVTLLVELAAASGIWNIPTVINGVRNGNAAAVAGALEAIGRSLQDMKDALQLMHGDVSHTHTHTHTHTHPYCIFNVFLFLVHVKPAVFYGIMRIFLSGWKDNPSMPSGLVYQGVQPEPLEYSGGSAAQSSLLHCFDELLGVEHGGKSGAFLTRMRSYMPPAHRKLIEDISLQTPLKTFVQQRASEELTQAFQNCLTKLLALRNYHITVVSRFITIPAARARQIREQTSGVEELISKAPAALEEMGTGGSSIMTFLKHVRRETKEAFLSESEDAATGAEPEDHLGSSAETKQSTAQLINYGAGR
ncbi:indoleamine 2,3-dioxygenase 1 isoform X3 [Takifugu flavidus]|uniref:indoleamine 2,3-dioxygenase 1 isoform X3 n=1 Tax=Takifugu flavidus TaxID=433684 RepID=UPI0025442030|nr:indoleamine 2,3-dioxygenase 1 isoform X3 [Takifugu flavidus]